MTNVDGVCRRLAKSLSTTGNAGGRAWVVVAMILFLIFAAAAQTPVYNSCQNNLHGVYPQDPLGRQTFSNLGCSRLANHITHRFHDHRMPGLWRTVPDCEPDWAKTNCLMALRLRAISSRRVFTSCA